MVDETSPAPIVRVSLGWYPAEHEREVAALLDYRDRTIGEEIRALRDCAGTTPASIASATRS